MNYKLTGTFRKKFSRGLRIILFFTISIFHANGQSTIPPYSDVAKQRLLIRITAHYLHTVSQGQIDMDSAVRIPCKVYGLSPLLVYNEGYSNGKPSAGSKLLDAGKVNEANALLPHLHGEARVRLLLELGTYLVFKPGTEKKDLDQASKYINEAVVLSENLSTQWKIEGMILQANFFHQSGRIEESQGIFTRALKLCEESGNTLAKAGVLLISGKLLPYGHPSRLSNFESARSIFQTLHAKEKEIEALSEMTIEHFVFERYDLSEQSAVKTVELEKEIGYHHLQYAYDALSYMSLHKGDYVRALSFCNRSLESLSSAEDSVFISLFLTRKGTILQHVDRNEEALALFSKAFEHRFKETRLFWYTAFLNKASTLIIMDRSLEAMTLLKETQTQFPPITIFEKMHFSRWMGEAYEQLNRFDLAEDHYEFFLTLADHVPVEYLHSEFPQCLSDIASFYMKAGNTRKSRSLLEKEKPFLSGGDARSNYLYHYCLFEIDSIEKRYVQAIRNLQLSEQFLDSALSQEQRKNVDELLVQYETEKKDKDIQLLKQQGELQQTKLQQSQFTQRVTFVGAGLLLSIAALLYYLYRTKQKSNTQLKHLLTEKEWLLKEVHHRVKNNLQTVLSLLESQSRRLIGNEALHALQESQNRVYAMSLIHKKLYQSTDIASINMEDYLRDLIQHLRESFGQSGPIQFSLDLKSINLDVSQAVPVGLIVNEAITNSIKYAFPENIQDSEIFVSLKTTGDKVDLTISDNGVGMTQAEKEKPQNLGLKLMKGLTEDIDGFFTMNTEKGVSIQVLFVPNVPLQKVNVEVLLTQQLQSA